MDEELVWISRAKETLTGSRRSGIIFTVASN